MAYDGFYSELSTRGSTNEVLNLAIQTKEEIEVLAGQAQMSADEAAAAGAAAGAEAGEAAATALVNGKVAIADLIDIADPLKGAAMVGRGGQVVNSFDALGTLSKNSPSKIAFATACNSLYQGIGGGHYRLDPTDVTSVEVKGVIKVAADGSRWKLIHNGKINIEQMGCVGLPGINNFSDLQNAVAYAYTNHITLIAGSATYEYGTTLDLGYPQLCLFGAGIRNTVFKYTGTGGIAMDINGNRPNNGAFSFDIDLADFTLEGNSTAVTLLRCRVNHPRLRNINAREASTASGVAFRLQGPVLGYFENLTCSTNTQLMTSRPLNGIIVEADPTDGRRATANTFINPIIEGMLGDGIRWIACDAAVVTGGSSENNAGTGIIISSGCQMNTLIGFDCESNLGYADIYESGSFNKFLNCGTHKKFYFDNSSVSSSVEGGWHNEFETGSGAAWPEISRVKVRFFGGATAFTSNGNASFSIKEMFDVQLGAFIYPNKPVTTITVSTGSFTYTNNSNISESIIVTGGTFGSIVLNRGVVAGAAALPNTGMFLLQPGDGISWGTVTVAPTVKRVPNGATFF